MIFLNPAALIKFYGIKVKILMRALLWRKGTRLLPAGFGFLRWLRTLWAWWRPSPHTVQWSHRETHSLIKILACLGVTHKNWPFSDLSSHGGLRLLEAESETHKTTWNESEVTPGEVKLTRSTWAHYTSSLVIFIPDKFSLKWETESLKNRNKVGVQKPASDQYSSQVHAQYTLSSLLQVRT